MGGQPPRRKSEDGPDELRNNLRANFDCVELQKRFIAIEVQPSFV